MNMLFRSIREDDLEKAFNLSKQFALLNLPSNKKDISEIIQSSVSSFKGDFTRDLSKYIFVVEDLETGFVCRELTNFS